LGYSKKDFACNLFYLDILIMRKIKEMIDTNCLGYAYIILFLEAEITFLI
jgi:hypothetical protein